MTRRDLHFRPVAEDHGRLSPHAFGPLSSGVRRLNVLISRAKLRCEVLQFTGADIDLEGRAGVSALKLFLAETGHFGLGK
jgi:hypothetical protein